MTLDGVCSLTNKERVLHHDGLFNALFTQAVNTVHAQALVLLALYRIDCLAARARRAFGTEDAATSATVVPTAKKCKGHPAFEATVHRLVWHPNRANFFQGAFRAGAVVRPAGV